MSDIFEQALKDMGTWTFDDSRPTRQFDWDLAICAAVEELCAILEARSTVDEWHSSLVRRAREDVAKVRRKEERDLSFPPWRAPGPLQDGSRSRQRALVTALDALDAAFRAHVDSPRRFEKERLKEARGLSGYLKTVFMREDTM